MPTSTRFLLQGTWCRQETDSLVREISNHIWDDRPAHIGHINDNHVDDMDDYNDDTNGEQECLQ